MSYQIRPATPADFAAIAALISSQNPEPTTVEDILRHERLRNPADPWVRLVAVDGDSNLLATGSASYGTGSRPGEFSIRVRTWKQHESRGIGTALYNLLEAFVREQGGSGVESRVNDDDTWSLRWTERQGYQKKQHLFESSLSLPDWDPSPFLSAVEAARAAGIRFTTLADEGDVESLLPRFYEFSTGLLHDIPGMEDRPRLSYDEWTKWVAHDPHFDPKLVCLMADGDRWVGLGHMSQQKSGTCYNNVTAISREYRGKGLSLAIKVAALSKAKEMGAPSIRTNNDSTNSRMLATNQRLGYKPAPGFYLLIKHLLPA